MAELAQLPFGGVAVALRADGVQRGGGTLELLFGAVAVTGAASARPARVRDRAASIGVPADPRLLTASRARPPLSIAGVERNGRGGAVCPCSSEWKPDLVRAGLGQSCGSLCCVALPERESAPGQEFEEVRAPAVGDERHVGAAGCALQKRDSAVGFAGEQLRLGEHERCVCHVVAWLPVVAHIDGLLRGGHPALDVAGRERDL